MAPQAHARRANFALLLFAVLGLTKTGESVKVIVDPVNGRDEPSCCNQSNPCKSLHYSIETRLPLVLKATNECASTAMHKVMVQLLPGLYQLLLQIGPGPHLYVADTGVVKLSQQILQLHVVNSFFLYFSVEFRSDLEGDDNLSN